MTDERLHALFSQFDIDDSNFITKQNIKDAFTKLGREMSDKDVDQIIREHDIAGDKQISFEEFKIMMTKELKGK